eukprot:2830055-Pyramimonas_sp.AAC.1
MDARWRTSTSYSLIGGEFYGGRGAVAGGDFNFAPADLEAVGWGLCIKARRWPGAGPPASRLRR